MYTTNEYESALTMMGVKIIEIKLENKYVTKVIGVKNGMLLNWNARGECFLSKKPCPEHNVLFTVVSENQNTLFYGNAPFKFKAKTIFTPKYMCLICHLQPQCHADLANDFPFPCVEDQRKDKKNGYFKRIKAL